MSEKQMKKVGWIATIVAANIPGIILGTITALTSIF